MAGREWRPQGQPVKVEDHSFFTGPEVEQAIPYGIYDITRDSGWVNVGTDHDTSVFAVESIRRWWRARGRDDYPGASRLLITADAGGSNSYRYRVWKSELAALAAETGLVITVCHFPPGTSKWNKIEHRLFSHITMNWRGRPLTSHEVVVQTIAATRTSRGLRVEAVLDPGDYPTGVAVSQERFAALPLQRHAVRGAWNYTLRPAAGAPPGEGTTGQRSSPAHRRQQMLAKLNDERLTGMTRTDLASLCTALAPLQAARAQQRHSAQRGGRARRAAGKPRGKPLFDDPARVLLTLLYQRQACSMNVLADLLEVTATCIGDLVGETREVLEDHGHATGTAAVRFPTAQALRTFLDSDARPQRAQITDQISHPALTGLSRPPCTTSPGNSHRCKPPRPNASATSGAAACASPPPAAASSTKRSATQNASCWPSSTSGTCAQWTCWPASWVSAGPRSATPSAKPSRSSTRPGMSPRQQQPATAPAATCSPPWHPRQTPCPMTQQVESLQPHYAANLMAATPKGPGPGSRRCCTRSMTSPTPPPCTPSTTGSSTPSPPSSPKSPPIWTRRLQDLAAMGVHEPVVLQCTEVASGWS